MNELKELEIFNTSCDEFISGKYLLADLKISSILNIISNNEKLSNIVNNCLQSFDFDSQVNNYMKFDSQSSFFALPTNDPDIISFVYSLLYRFNTKQIKFNDFLKTYFNEDDSIGTEFNKFAQVVIIPFKTSINSIYSKRHILTASKEYENNQYNKIIASVKLILKNLENYKLKMDEKEEFTLLLNALYIASEKNDKKTVYALMVGLDYFTKRNKKLRNTYLMLEECFEKN